MTTYRIYAEFNNETEREIIIKNTKAAALAVQEFFVSEHKEYLTFCTLFYYDEIEKCEFAVNSKFDVNEY
jgi:hypothetical protein